MRSILLYQFVNLLGRFDERILHSNLLLDKIDKAGFASYLAFYTAHLGPSDHPIGKWLGLDLDSLRIIY